MRYTVRNLTQQSWASGVTTATTLAFFKQKVPKKVVQIEVIMSTSTNSVTGALALATANGGTLVSISSAAAGTGTIFQSHSKGATDSDFAAFIMDGEITATFTPSGDPGTTGVTMDVRLFLEDE